MGLKVTFRQQKLMLQCTVTAVDNNSLKDKIQDYFNDDDEWMSYMNMVFPDSRCDNESYLDLRKDPTKWINLDMLYDFSDETNQSSHHLFNSQEELQIKLQKFKEWWDNVYPTVIDHLTNHLGESERIYEFSDTNSPNYILPELPTPPSKSNLNINSPTKLLIVGNEIYKLSCKKNGNLDDVKKELESKYENDKKFLYQQMKAYKDRVEKEVQEKINMYKKLPLFPSWWNSEIITKRKVLICSTAWERKKLLRVFIPIDFRPLFILDGDGTKYKIKRPIKTKKIYLSFCMDSKGNTYKKSCMCYHRNLKRRFWHYHSMDDYDCTGDIKFPQIHNHVEFWKLVEVLETGLKVINYDSIASSHPDSLPNVKDYDTEEVEGWSTD